MKKTAGQDRVWVGIDWGHTGHAVAVVSDHNKCCEQFGIENGPAGYRALERKLAVYEVAGIAIESTRHALLLFLQDTAHKVYLINPRQSKAWRDTDTISGAKSVRIAARR